MPFFIPVNLDAAYPLNQKGELAEDQKQALVRAFKARSLVGVILFWTDLFLGTLFIGVIATGDWNTQFALQMIFTVMALSSLATIIFGLKVRSQSKQLIKMVPTLMVRKIHGVPTKYNAGVAYELGGATHTLPLRVGNVKIDGVMYGVLPGKLYGEIVDQKAADFYVIDAATIGYKKFMIVNASN